VASVKRWRFVGNSACSNWLRKRLLNVSGIGCTSSKKMVGLSMDAAEACTDLLGALDMQIRRLFCSVVARAITV
jgi:hypothetical protein